MRRIVYYVASSLDGFIAKPDGGVEWLFSPHEHGYSQFEKTFDTVLIGRKTFEQSVGFGWTFEGARCYVYSRTKSAWNFQHVIPVSGLIEPLADDLKGQAGKDIFLCGGAELAGQFLNAKRVDEIVVSIHPVVLGAGIPLFSGVREPSNFKLTHSRVYPSGLVQVTYAPLP